MTSYTHPPPWILYWRVTLLYSISSLDFTFLRINGTLLEDTARTYEDDDDEDSDLDELEEESTTEAEDDDEPDDPEGERSDTTDEGQSLYSLHSVIPIYNQYLYGHAC